MTGVGPRRQIDAVSLGVLRDPDREIASPQCIGEHRHQNPFAGGPNLFVQGQYKRIDLAALAEVGQQACQSGHLLARKGFGFGNSRGGLGRQREGRCVAESLDRELAVVGQREKRGIGVPLCRQIGVFQGVGGAPGPVGCPRHADLKEDRVVQPGEMIQRQARLIEEP